MREGEGRTHLIHLSDVLLELAPADHADPVAEHLAPRRPHTHALPNVLNDLERCTLLRADEEVPEKPQSLPNAEHRLHTLAHKQSGVTTSVGRHQERAASSNTRSSVASSGRSSSSCCCCSGSSKIFSSTQRQLTGTLSPHAVMKSRSSNSKQSKMLCVRCKTSMMCAVVSPCTPTPR
jgi:hypothetical protein